MSIVTGLDIPPENYELFRKACDINQSFGRERIEKKAVVYRTRNFSSLIERSSFQSISNKWDLLSSLERSAWEDAGYWANMSGWDLFQQDTLYRINNGLAGTATPSEYHQLMVGKLTIEAPAESCIIRQNWNMGMGGTFYYMFNFQASFVSTGAGSYMDTFFYWSEIDEWDEVYYWEENVGLWNTDTWDWWDDGYGDTDGYTLYYFEIVIYKYRGILYFDGLVFNHEDENIARDWQCNDVDPNWVKTFFPVGCKLETVYPPDE
jgi:hypothetical protein